MLRLQPGRSAEAAFARRQALEAAIAQANAPDGPAGRGGLAKRRAQLAEYFCCPLTQVRPDPLR